MRTRSKAIFSISFVLILAGCEALTYGYQAFEGHGAVLNARVDIDDAIANTDLPPEVRAKLRLSKVVIAFAETEGLSVGGNYRHYARTDEKAVVYNVFATPEFDLTAVENCFPVVGCVAYRGFYRRSDAEAYGENLAAQGFDTAIFPIRAYSTLGWTADPLTTAMLSMAPDDFVRTLFHESVHTTLYLGGDTSFDEGLAEAVAEVLSARFWQTFPELTSEFAPGSVDQSQYERSALAVSEAARVMRLQLAALYQNSDVGVEERRAIKADLFRQFRAWHRANQRGLAPYTYAALFLPDMNNAYLLAFGVYDDLKPSIRQALEDRFNGNVQALIAWARSTQSMSPQQRRQALAAL